MRCPKAVIFDLDDTLAESFKRPSDEVLSKMLKLLGLMPVAIMTGSSMKRMEEQFLSDLVASAHIDRMYLFPNSSAQCFTYLNGAWALRYDLGLTEEERDHIKATIYESLETIPELRDIPFWGERMFDRGAQIAYTPVGIEAPLEKKRAWDPDGVKRTKLVDALKTKLPDLEILMGGTTTVDITRKGVNKAQGVKWLAEELRIPTADMLYVGDAFYEGGNDRVVIPTGIVTRAVSGPEETPAVLEEILTTCRT